jgi:pimeloyl-ACP methyl ester carboxylesterase
MTPQTDTRATAHAEILQADCIGQDALAIPPIRYRTVEIDGAEIFYREAGAEHAPAIVLLHGFPTSSHMYRNLIPALADQYRVIAPDYPGFGYSAPSDPKSFDYSFDHYADLIEELLDRLGVSTFTLYVVDYGAPVGFRIAARQPERVSALLVQNGNAYEEGIAGFWDPIKAYWSTGATAEREALRWLTTIKATLWQYQNGVDDPTMLSPDAWTHDQALMDRPGNADIQLDLFYDYRTNLPLYSEWQD